MSTQADTSYLRPREVERMRKSTRNAAARAIELMNQGVSREAALTTVGISGRSLDRYVRNEVSPETVYTKTPEPTAPALSLFNADHERRIAALEAEVQTLTKGMKCLMAGISLAITGVEEAGETD